MAIKGEGADTGAAAEPAAEPAAAAAPEADAFDTAFDDLTAPEPAKEPAAEPAKEPAAEPAKEPAAEPAKEPAAEPAKEPVAEPAKEPAAEPAAKPAAGADDAAADDILSKLSKLIKEAPAEAKPGEPKPEPAAEPALYNEEETTFLTEYDKEWGDVVKGEALKRRAEYKELLGYVFQQVADYLKPIQGTVDLLATRTHLADIETNIPDYSDQLRDEVTAWVETQPAYLQTAYNQVITQGTPEEVKDLVERYRGATGKAAPAAAEAKPEPKPDGKDNELSGAAKQAAAALAPVASERSRVAVPEGDAGDFDGSWKEAVKLLEG